MSTRAGRKKKERRKKIRNYKNITLNVIGFLLTQIIVITTFSIPMVYYGPFENLREMVVTSAMTTFSHQYLATAFLSKATINDIMNKNKVDTSDKNSDEAAIQTFSKTKLKDDKELNDARLDSAIEKKRDKIEIVDISNERFKGYVVLVSNPQRVGIGTSKNIGIQGMKLIDIVKKYNALGGINAGGFEDNNGSGNGGTPEGILVENGQIVYGEGSSKYSIIGFNDDSVLVLGQYSLNEIKQKKIRDAASFGPFLIVDGEPMVKDGNGGWGLAPRTAIGQKKDGTVIMLVIDGRQIGSLGATLKEVQDIMIQFGAHNAANLDGGASTTMVYDNKILNKPCSMYGPRDLPSAFIIKQ